MTHKIAELNFHPIGFSTTKRTYRTPITK